MKGVTVPVQSVRVPVPYFNPHTREGCDDARPLQGHPPDLISIHTPVKGVTRFADGLPEGVEISIHTPVKGVTFSDINDPARHLEFQSTHP